MTINCRGYLLDVSHPVVMAILNVTPDSFYDGGQHESTSMMRSKVDQYVHEGATIIDIGGMSSRPGAAIIDKQEEIKRVLPAIKYVMETHPDIFISIDTLHAEVALAALKEGAHMVNDISGGTHDPTIIAVCIDNHAPYIAMHMQGKPKDMQNEPSYDDVMLEILKYFDKKIYDYRSKGLVDIIIDPGFGFGKTVEHNYTLLRELGVFRILDCPILVGLSRKSMIYKPLKTTPQEALNGTSALHMIALQHGANILRVHDVKEAKECIDLYRLLSK